MVIFYNIARIILKELKTINERVSELELPIIDLTEKNNKLEKQLQNVHGVCTHEVQ